MVTLPRDFARELGIDSFLLPFGSFGKKIRINAHVEVYDTLSTPFWEFLDMVLTLSPQSSGLLKPFYSLLGVSIDIEIIDRYLRYAPIAFYSLLGVSAL